MNTVELCPKKESGRESRYYVRTIYYYAKTCHRENGPNGFTSSKTEMLNLISAVFPTSSTLIFH